MIMSEQKCRYCELLQIENKIIRDLNNTLEASVKGASEALNDHVKLQRKFQQNQEGVQRLNQAFDRLPDSIVDMLLNGSPNLPPASFIESICDATDEEIAKLADEFNEWLCRKGEEIEIDKKWDSALQFNSYTKMGHSFSFDRMADRAFGAENWSNRRVALEHLRQLKNILPVEEKIRILGDD